MDRAHRARFRGFWCMSLSTRMSLHQLILASNDNSCDLFRRSRRAPHAWRFSDERGRLEPYRTRPTDRAHRTIVDSRGFGVCLSTRMSVHQDQLILASNDNS